jgi:hypothetical protein
MANMNTLLVWREQKWVDLAQPVPWKSHCPFCEEAPVHLQCASHGPLVPANHDLIEQGSLGEDHEDEYQCPLCGWLYTEREGGFVAPGPYVSAWASVLREFPIDSLEIAAQELGTHLRRHYTDVYALSPWTFERLVEEIYKAHGHIAVRTLKTRDGGVDVKLFSKDGRTITGIIECKRNAIHRKIGVGVLKTLFATAFDWSVSCATLVTSSTFTSGAVTYGRRMKRRGFTINLVDASEILKLLEVYNEQLPPLHQLDPTERRKIVNENLSRVGSIPRIIQLPDDPEPQNIDFWI